MKKIKTKQYARALYYALEGKKRDEIKDEVNNFVKLLYKNKALSKTDEIIEEFEKYSKEQAGILDVEVISARILESAEKNKLVERIKKIKKVSEVNLENKQDESLIGGIVVKIGDTVLDGSIKTKLDLLKQALQ